MEFLIGVLLFVLFLNALFLILLILVQLPKKEAGIGMAFGGGAGEALFQGGAANALSKLTTKGTILFLSLTLVVSVLVSANSSKSSGSAVSQLLPGNDGQAVPVSLTDTNAAPTPDSNQSTNQISIPIPENIGEEKQPVEISIPVPEAIKADENASAPDNNADAGENQSQGSPTTDNNKEKE